MRVFYIDDDIEDLLLFSDILREIDPEINCNTLTDSSEALRQLQYNPPPDVIFLDFNMPQRNGEDCLLLIRAMEHLKNVPIVIYSTGVNFQLKQRLLDKELPWSLKNTAPQPSSRHSSSRLS